jgi:cell division protein FtsB
MKAPLARLAFAIAILALGSYAVFAWRGPGGFRALSEKEARIKELERSNEALAKEIERRREHIRRLNENPAEQELEIRDRLKLVHPNEKVYITGEPEKEKKPFHK